MGKPKIRFRGFNDDWEQRKLLDCIQKITDFRGRTPKKLGMNWSESGYLALSALNVKDGYIDFLQDVHYGDQALYDKWMTGNELHKGQVLFTTEAPMGNVAQIPDNRRYILSQRTIAFDVKPELIIENFLAIVLRTPTVFASLTALSSGGTAKGVSQKSLATVEITIPVNLNEQEQLASIFSIIDHLITLHQRKCEETNKIKKYMLQNMFPQDGEKTPKIRFEGFTDDWEQRKLGEFGKATGGTSIESEFVEEGNYKVISIGSYSETSKYNDQGLRTNKTSKTESKILNKDDLTMILNDKTAAGNIIGRVLLVDADNSYVYNQRTERIEVYKKEFVPFFLYQLLNAENIRSKIIKASQGNTQIYVNWSTISELKYPIPRVKSEQKKIATFFNNLDNLITLHQRKRDELQNLKKFMLQNMFV